MFTDIVYRYLYNIHNELINYIISLLYLRSRG